jgi:3-oxoacyl-[acyl-carrier-protein] synthase III
VIPVKIKGTGSALAARVVPNSHFEKIIDSSDEWIVSRTGIKQRRFIEDDQGLIDLVLPASQAALAAAGVEAAELDLIVVGTSTADMISPPTACLLQGRLEANNAVAFDINAGCPGFIYSLSTAQQFLGSGSRQLALVAGGEAVSTIMDYEDRATCVLFGDGAGAVVLEPAAQGEASRLLSTHIHSDGRLWELIHVPGGGSRHPASYEMIEARLPYVKMKGGEVFRHAVRAMCQVAREALDQNGLSVADLDWFIPHQANVRIMDTVAKRLELPREKVIVTVHKYGNTSAATIPTALDEAVRDGRIKRGDLILATSFGAGLTWGAALLRY